MNKIDNKLTEILFAYNLLITQKLNNSTNLNH